MNDKQLQELSAGMYHDIERVLNDFKNKKIGYSEAIHRITEKYSQRIKQILPKD